MIGDLILLAFGVWAGGAYVGYQLSRHRYVAKLPALYEAVRWPWLVR